MMLLYLIADYMNILDLVSLKTDRFNVGFFAVFVDNIIVLTIAVMTYYVIDKKAVYRQHNQEEVAKAILKRICDRCKVTVDSFDDAVIAEAIIKKAKFNEVEDENSPVGKLNKNPFQNEEYLMNAFLDGVLEKNILVKYLEFKETYSDFVFLRITLFDYAPLYEEKKKKFLHKYEELIGLVK